MVCQLAMHKLISIIVNFHIRVNEQSHLLDLLSNLYIHQSFHSAFQKLNRTKLNTGYSFGTESFASCCYDECHYPNICIICDRFIHGPEELHWMSKGKTLNNADSKYILLSPRAVMRWTKCEEGYENSYNRSIRNDRKCKNYS
jgi:hypothetical protein